MFAFALIVLGTILVVLLPMLLAHGCHNGSYICLRNALETAKLERLLFWIVGSAMFTAAIVFLGWVVLTVYWIGHQPAPTLD